MLINYEGQDFAKLVEEGLTVVDFFATWCGPCKMLTPVFEEVAKEESDARFVKIDIDQYRSLAANTYKVTSIPTLILFKDGAEVSRRTGFAPKDAILKWISEHK